jgi:HD-GYP domain-containing protein (c-di-GMP phosphodiesterase class II)
MSEAARPGGADQTAQEERELQRLARDFLFAFYAALRVLKLYPLENQSVRNALRDLERTAQVLLSSEGEITVRLVSDFLFVNDVRLRFDLGSYATFGALGRALRRHDVGQITITSGVTHRDWTAAVTLLQEEADAEDPFDALLRRLGASRLEHITFDAAKDQLPRYGELAESREVARRTYTQSVAVARDVMAGARIGKGIGLRRVKRAVQSIVDQVLSNEASIVGMTTLRDYDEYTFTHSVNVCIFSVALGKRLGLSKQELYELGLGALLHDIGKQQMPLELINKTTPLSNEEWNVMREHPLEGMLMLFGLRGLAEIPLRAMLIAYEHHMKIDLTGYPSSTRPRSPTLFPKIVAVADAFDAATSRRSYQSIPYPPDRVLGELRDNPARGFDPVIVKAFISMTGIYPVGSLVLLDTYELAVVVAANPDPAYVDRPVVRVLFNDLGVPIIPAPTVDLSESDPATGRPRRSILQTTDPERYGINVTEYIV